MSSDMCVIICQSGLSSLNGGPCVLCESGKYKTIADTGLCINTCPMNTDSEEGDTSINDCLCVSGYSKEESELCTFCDSGKYKSGLGNGHCDECFRDVDDNNQFSQPDSMSSNMCVIICQIGLSSPNGGPCVLCESGKYKTISVTGLSLTHVQWTLILRKVTHQSMIVFVCLDTRKKNQNCVYFVSQENINLD